MAIGIFGHAQWEAGIGGEGVLRTICPAAFTSLLLLFNFLLKFRAIEGNLTYNLSSRIHSLTLHCTSQKYDTEDENSWLSIP